MEPNTDSEFRPWTAYRFFNVKPDAFSDNPIEDHTCIDSGHGLICYGNDSEEGFPLIVLYDGQTEDPPTITIPKKSKIKLIRVATYLNVLLAYCKTENSHNFYLYTTNDPIQQRGMISIKTSKIPVIDYISVSPKIKRFAIKENDRTLCLYELPYTKKSTGTLITTPDIITNHLMVSDYQLQRIIYVTTTAQVLAYYRLARKKISKPYILDEKGCRPGFCSTASDGRLIVIRETIVSIYKDNSFYTSFQIDQVPRLMRWMKNSYLICCFNVPNSTSSVRIYNPETHATFGRCSDGDHVQQILIEWNSVILMLDDGSATKLTESNMQEKIQQLINNEQFDVALVVASSQQLGSSLICEIHRQRGDSYFAKRMYHEAIEEYKLTIGQLEASYVITRFIDPQHAEYLVDYLEALSEKHLETKQHTTLRFNCYTKLRKQDKLRAIIDQCLRDAEERKEPSFDLETAVQVLCLADFNEDALKIARAYKMHSTYTRMLWEKHDYQGIFEYLQTVETNIALMILKKYGSDLMQFFNEEMRNELIEFLIMCCHTGLRAKPDSNEKKRINPDDIVRVFITFPEYLYTFLTKLIAKFKTTEQIELVTQNTWNTVIELAVTLNHPEEVERYFAMANGRFDSEQLLLMFKAEKCTYGLLLLYDHLKYYQEIILISSDEQIPDNCAKYGPYDENVYRLGLEILSVHKNSKQLERLVQIITDTDALPFLAVFQILRKFEFATFKTLKVLAQKTFRTRQENIKELYQEYNALEEYVVQKEDLTLELTYNHFIAKQMRCDGCKNAIDLPVKHFLCGHSFHLRCLGEDLTKCPVCKERQEKIVQAKVDSLKNSANYLTKNLPTEKNKYRFLDIVSNAQDNFASLSSLFTTDVMYPDDEDETKLKEADELLKQYTLQ
ncbi:vacuolar protein sorting-associated protein 11 [Histomonas meleagridis]|uniref:vacuolar protein sorting-associated protein 11-like n=1 Tax=Histomonas meleagridis TaxID=135588 RepID=UPI00355AB1F1|nr:vacuolar protein sorting-associated protein 11 [Histomonas meleagridis]KAH0805933.1 vacuolar protein sorting-associated protein 11-like [Histomonas meleagridis]